MTELHSVILPMLAEWERITSIQRTSSEHVRGCFLTRPAVTLVFDICHDLRQPVEARYLALELFDAVMRVR